jgi:hypothetical protein
MIRARLVFAAAVVALSVPAGAALYAQTPPAPDLHPVLAGRKLDPPLKGTAQIDVVYPPSHSRDKDTVITKIQLKNVSNGPVSRLTIEEPWYDKDGAIVASGRATVPGMLQPNEVQIVTLTTAYNPKMQRSNYQFSHANGTVNVNKVAKMEAPASAKPAAAAKK